MARRKPGREWSAVGMPRLRDRLADEHLAAITRIDQHVAAERISLTDGADMHRDLISQAHTIENAPLFWVADQMVDVAVNAAASLPEWSPTWAMPSLAGFLMWAKPAGRIGWNGTSSREHAVTWDAIWWRTHNGTLRIQMASRLVGHRDELSPGWANTPLMASREIIIPDPGTPRTSDDHAGDELGTSLSVVASTWLLMGQHRIAETRVQRESSGRVEDIDPDRPATVRDVTIIDLRRDDPKPTDTEPGHHERRYRSRWWVGGHWRQQACGPARSQRKPVWIAPHIKGPADLPVSDKERVHVWRR